MSKTRKIWLYQPHIAIMAEDGVHVFPVNQLRKMAQVGTEPLSDDALRAIIHDWLKLVETFGTFVPAERLGLQRGNDAQY